MVRRRAGERRRRGRRDLHILVSAETYNLLYAEIHSINAALALAGKDPITVSEWVDGRLRSCLLDRPGLYCAHWLDVEVDRLAAERRGDATPLDVKARELVRHFGLGGEEEAKGLILRAAACCQQAMCRPSEQPR